MQTREIKIADGSLYLTAEEAANILHIKESAIRNYLSLGLLTTFKFKTLTLLKKDEVERWKDRQKK